MIRFLKAINRFQIKVRTIIRLIPLISSIVDDPSKKSFHPEREIKSRRRIYLENLLWLIKYGELCENYYMYGFEQKDRKRDWGDYIDYTSFKHLRNKHNRNKWIGSYCADYTCLLKDKFLFNRMLVSLGFPTPRVFVLYSGGRLHWLEGGDLSENEAIRKLEGKRVFCKSILGECADGVFPLRIENGKIYYHGEIITIPQILDLTGGSFIMQEEIVQHPEMARLFPNSVNTMRIVSFHSAEGTELFCGVLRAGTGENTSDNWAIGGILGIINVETGALDKEFLYKPEYGTICREHPDTGVVLGDFQVPFFHEAMDMIRELHPFFYGVKSIGWDIAITEDGPVFIEGNDNWEMNSYQKDEGARRKTLERFNRP